MKKPNHSLRRIRAVLQLRGLHFSTLALAAFASAAAWSILSGRRIAAAELPPVAVAEAEAKSETNMKRYKETIPNTEATFEMVPIPGGEFMMGSPDDEEGRGDDEGPRHKVKISPFWMGKCEVTWDEYEVFMFSLDVQRREVLKLEESPRDRLADAVTRPTKPYTDMTFDMGKHGYPAICMTQYAAKMYCEWLSAKTGRYYRLPTEAEWEYACRAGTDTAYSFGNDAGDLDEYAWFYDNSENADGDVGYSKVGKKKPNPWGLHDMHGNVAEYVLDGHDAEFYKTCAANKKGVVDPYNPPTKLWERIVRGGSWEDDAPALRSAARRADDPSWKQQDPQLPQSIWYLTDALGVGFRIVRPLEEPDADSKKNFGPDKLQIWDRGKNPRQ